MVTQDTSLLHRSIAANIRYARPEAGDEQVEAAARAGKTAGKSTRKSGGAMAGKKVSLKAQQNAGRAAKRRK